MTTITILLSIAMASQALPAVSQPQTAYDQLVTQFETNFLTHNLRKFPHNKNNKFKVTMIYGSHGVPSSAESKVFHSMEELEEWLTPKGHHGEILLFERKIGSRTKFGQDIFSYNYNGFERGELYLTRIRFTSINSMISIFDITFFDNSGV